MVAGTDDANIARRPPPSGASRGRSASRAAGTCAPPSCAGGVLFFASFETFRYYLGKADLSWLT